MRILELSPYIFIDNHKYASKNKTGLAYMVRGIVEMLSENNEVLVYTQSILTSKQHIGNWVLLKKTVFLLCLNVKFGYFKQMIPILRQYKQFREKIRIFYYFLSAGLLDKYCRIISPEVIHIHGIGVGIIPFLLVSSKYGIPIVSTLHGLISWNDVLNVSPFQKSLERSFVARYVTSGCSLTVVGSNMKTRIEDYLGKPCSNITVINNANSEIIQQVPVLRRNDRRIIKVICVGSVNKHKNQIQMLRILPRLQKYFSASYTIHLDIVGDGDMLEEIRINSKEIPNVTIHGSLCRCDTYKLIASSDLLVFPSLVEGFGLPIIEAYCLGVPVVAFQNIDAYNDVYHEDCMIPVESYSDDALFEGVVMAIQRKWDRHKIIDFSQKFNPAKITEEYNEVIGKVSIPFSHAEMLRVIYDGLDQLNIKKYKK